MPTLGDLNCSIELGRCNSLLREYGTLYGNKRVSCWICAPPSDINFSIHLTSAGPNGFTAAPGLAMFVFIDGQYQCNRNITTVEEQKGAVDLRVRQKEEPSGDRRFIGRDWCCSPLNTGSASKATRVNPDFLSNLGTIEVVVLRCRTSSQTKGPGSLADVNDNTMRLASQAMSVKHADTESANGKGPKSNRPSKTAESTKSKTASVAGSGSGGLFGGFGLGLFDGAGDFDDRPSSRHGSQRTSRSQAVAPQNVHYHFNFGGGHVSDDIDAAVRLVQAQARSSSGRRSRGRSGHRDHYQDNKSHDPYASGKGSGNPAGAWAPANESGLKQDDNHWGNGHKPTTDAGAGGNNWSGNDWSKPEGDHKPRFERMQSRPKSKASEGGNNWFANRNDTKSSSKSSSVKVAPNDTWATQQPQQPVPGEWNDGGGGVWETKKMKPNEKGFEKVGSGVKHAEGNGWANSGDSKKSHDKAKVKGFETVGSGVKHAEADKCHAKPPEVYGVYQGHENIRPNPLSPYMQEPTTKPYWTNPGAAHKGYGELPVSARPSTIAPTVGLRDPYVTPAYDLPVVCAEFAASNGLEVQVKTGKGARYMHEVGQPNYLDTMDEPHAVFIFRYRTKGFLEKMVQAEISDKKESSKVKVRSMSRDELEKAYLRSQEKASTSRSSSTKPSHHRSSRRSASPSKTIPAEKKVSAWNDGNKAAPADNAWGATAGSKKAEDAVAW